MILTPGQKVLIVDGKFSGTQATVTHPFTGEFDNRRQTYLRRDGEKGQVTYYAEQLAPIPARTQVLGQLGSTPPGSLEELRSQLMLASGDAKALYVHSNETHECPECGERQDHHPECNRPSSPYAMGDPKQPDADWMLDRIGWIKLALGRAEQILSQPLIDEPV